MRLLRRVIAEKRTPVGIVGAALVVGVGLYMFGVLPLRARVEAAQRRADAALDTLDDVRRGLVVAEAASDEAARMDDALGRFYDEWLPGDLSDAREIAGLRIAELAERLGLTLDRRSSVVESSADAGLVRLKTTVVLSGAYADIRQVIYELETAPEFVVIEEVALSQTGESFGVEQVLTLGVSTYFRDEVGHDG